VSVNAVYDFEGAMEGACKLVFTDESMTCYTPQDSITQQRSYPRIEATFALGVGGQRFVLIDPTTGEAPAGVEGRDLWKYRRESAWDGTLTLQLITAADIAAHTAYRCKLRNKIAALEVLINGTAPMDNHYFSLTRDGGSTATMMAQDKSYMRTDFTFYGKISVQADAWAKLAQP